MWSVGGCGPALLVQVWMGDARYGDALAAGTVKVDGRQTLVRSLRQWLSLSPFAGVGRPDP